MLPVSLDCFCFVCLKQISAEKLATWGIQDEDKQNKKNPEKLETWGTQDEDKQNKSNPEKMVT
jgi:hypothetical protein